MLYHLNETVQPIHLKYYSFMVQKHPLLQLCRSRTTSAFMEVAHLLTLTQVMVIMAHYCSDLPSMHFFASTNPILPFCYALKLGETEHESVCP